MIDRHGMTQFADALEQAYCAAGCLLGLLCLALLCCAAMGGACLWLWLR